MSPCKDTKQTALREGPDVRSPPRTEDSAPSLSAFDVTALGIDRSADVDCDPYNRTGRFLADKIRRFEE